MTAVAVIAGGMLAAAAVLGLVRLLRGPSVLDRAAALELILSCCIGAIALTVAVSGEADVLIVLVVLALVSFVGAVAMARFATARGDL